MVLHMPWTRDLGGPRAQFELAEEFRRRGHQVDVFDIRSAHIPANSLAVYFQHTLFQIRAARFIRANGAKYDVIDAQQHNIVKSKEALKFSGVLSVRSVGLVHFYEQFITQQSAMLAKHSRSGEHPIGFLLRRLARLFFKSVAATNKSFAVADCIMLCNEDEYNYMAQHLHYGEKSFYVPFGLNEQQQEQLAACSPDSTRRIQSKTVVFVGSWSMRKGSLDWAEVIMRVRKRLPSTRFLFLGTGSSASAVLRDLHCTPNEGITIVPHYSNDDLPRLLSEGTVGAFPSYIEGFPYAVLEQLAAGLPVVAYDVPGSRQTLNSLDPTLLVPPGDITAFADRICDLLLLDSADYIQLSAWCKHVAHEYSWSNIATRTLEIYKGAYSSIQSVKKSV